MKDIQSLENCFNMATKYKKKYVAVIIKMQGFESPELIINTTKNFKEKLEYYKKAYNEDLTLKSFNGIKIIDFVGTHSIDKIESVYKLHVNKED